MIERLAYDDLCYGLSFLLSGKHRPDTRGARVRPVVVRKCEGCSVPLPEQTGSGRRRTRCTACKAVRKCA